MTTIIIDDKSIGAKKMIEYLRTLPYIKIVEDREPGPSLRKSMEEARTGKTKEIKDTAEYFKKIRKSTNV